jgi:hypothetical protein
MINHREPWAIVRAFHGQDAVPIQAAKKAVNLGVDGCVFAGAVRAAWHGLDKLN